MRGGLPLLGDLAVGRDNNLNLLRFAAALGVVVSHTVLISQGRDEMPRSMWLLGHICVGVFFVISGFLIPASFERAASARDYVLARVLRIMPALLVCVLATALVVGPAITELSTVEYFRDGGWAEFIVGNLSLIWEVEALPGVFSSNPFPDAQITFWTLKHEAGAYAIVLLIGVGGFLRDRIAYAMLLLGFGVVWGLVVREMDHDPEAMPLQLFQFVNLLGYFFLGMTAYLFRARLPLSVPVAVGLVAALWLLWWTPVFHGLLLVTVAYCVLWFAYVPRGPLLGFNRLGDYSYGIYVYGVLVQQLSVALLGPQSPVENFLYALGPTLLLAALSWHFIERPCLSLRRKAAGLGPEASLRGLSPISSRGYCRTNTPVWEQRHGGEKHDA